MFLKRIKNSKLFKQTFAYAIINILDKTIPFLIIPILTRIVSKEGMGYYTLYQTLFNILIPFLTLSIDNAILVNFYKQRKEEFSKYFSTGVFLSLVIYFVGLGAGFLFSPQLSTLFGLPVGWVQITMIIVLLQFFSQLRKNLWRVKREPLKYGSYSVPLTFAKNVLGLLLVFYSDLGWKGIILGHFVGQFVFSIYAIITFRREGLLRRKLEFAYIKDMISFGGPISIHKVGVWSSNALNKILLNTILGVAATGSYGVAATFGIVITVIGDAVTKAYTPFLYEKLRSFNEKTAVQLVNLIYFYYSFYFLITIVMFLVGYYGVGVIFGELYADTKKFILPITFAASINALYKVHVDFISFTKKTYLIAAVTITCGLLNVVIAYQLISTFGIAGAAYSSVVVQLLIYVTIFYIGSKQFKLPWLHFIHYKKE